jgi:pyruvate,orthophosphate dikinase
MTKWVYNFGAGVNDGNATLRNLLGGKGANLAEMASIDLPVPPGFTITTEVCTAYYDNNETYPAELKGQVETALARIEAAVGRKFGDKEKPLLVSVRATRKRSRARPASRSRWTRGSSSGARSAPCSAPG